jgi:4-aminobutyrate aminotransferase
VPVRGDGLTVEDIDGNLFLDFAAGIAVNSTGTATRRWSRPSRSRRRS